MHILDKLYKKKLINPPGFVIENLIYLVQTGSIAYGVNSDESDIDLYGVCIPPKKVIFPHLNGEIFDFGTQKRRFKQFEQHHIINNIKEYDISIYSIIKYFHLAMQNNPNIIDSLFVPVRCILYSNKIGQIIRENRKEFLHKGSWHRFKGYAYSQLTKLDNINFTGKRKEIVEKFGYDVKFAYHILRLILEAEQILMEGDLDLERNREELKSVRRGEWTKDAIKKWFEFKRNSLEEVYTNSKLQHSPNEKNIKQILLNCLEEYYGNLDNCITKIDQSSNIMNDLQNIILKYR